MNPKAAAEDLLGSYWVGDGFPVDPFSIARQLGIDVFTAPLPENVSGMLIKRVGEEPSIYLNQADAENRQRFSCAHELGHYVQHVGDGTAELGFVDKRDPLSSAGTDPAEQFANAFAANLLMPAADVRLLRQYRETYTPSRLAAHFGVSLAAINNRLVNLKLA